MDPTPSPEEIGRLRKTHGDTLTYLYRDLTGALQSLPDLYDEPPFEYHLTWEAAHFEKGIFSNLRQIVKAIDDNLPDLPRVHNQRMKIWIAFCRNLWLHELLLDEDWRDDREKSSYLDIAFRHVFQGFDTKAVANFETEFLPYDMPWASIAYHPTSGEACRQLESEVYHEFFKTSFQRERRFRAPPPQTLRSNDQLNIALRIANKRRDITKRVFYFDVKRFKLFEIFSTLTEEKKRDPSIQNVLLTFLFFELKRAMLWNSVFLLRARPFRELVDSFQGQWKLEHLREQKPEEMERQFLRLQTHIELLLLEKPSAPIDDRDLLPKILFQTSRPPPKPSPLLDLETLLPRGLLVTHEWRRQTSLDLNGFLRVWQRGVKADRVHCLLDNAQCLEDGGRALVDDCLKIKKIRAFHTIHRGTSGGKGLWEIKSYTSGDRGPLRPVKGKASCLLPYLCRLNAFDKSLVQLCAKSLHIAWTNRDWNALGEKEWVRVRTQSWFHIADVPAVREMLESGGRLSLPRTLKRRILDYLRGYKSPIAREMVLARLDGLIYGFKWSPSTTVRPWLQLWLEGLTLGNFSLAERVALLGEPHLKRIQRELGLAPHDYEEWFLILPQRAQAASQQEPSAKEVAGVDWRLDVRGFCHRLYQLSLDETEKLQVLQAGHGLLKQCGGSAEQVNDFIGFCEGLFSSFQEQSKAMTWFLCRLWAQHRPKDAKIKAHLRSIAGNPKQVEHLLDQLVRFNLERHPHSVSIHKIAIRGHMVTGDLQAAQVAIENLKRLKPLSAEDLLEIAEYYHMGNHFLRVLDWLVKRKQPGLRGEKYYLLLADSHRNLGHFTKAVKLCDHALKSGFRDINFYKIRTVCLFHLERFLEVIQTCGRGLENHGRDPELIFYRAAAHFFGRDYPACLEDTKRGLKLEKDHRGLLSLAGASLYWLDRYPEAARTLSLNIREHPENTFSSYFLANVYYRMHHYEEAEKIADALIMAMPDSHLPHYLKLYIHHALGREDEALAILDRLKTLDRGARPWLQEGQLFWRRRDMERASRAFAAALARAPNDPGTLNSMGLIRTAMGHPEEGREYFERAVAAGDARWNADYNRACALAVAGRSRSAVTALRAALRAHPDCGPRAAEDADLESLYGLASFKALTAMNTSRD